MAELVLVLAATVVTLLVGSWVGDELERIEGCASIVAFEVAVPDEGREPLRGIDDLERCGGETVPDGLEEAIEATNRRDFVFIPLYAVLLFWCAWRATVPANLDDEPLGGPVRRIKDLTVPVGSAATGCLVARIAKWGVLAAAALDVIENVGLAGPGWPGRLSWWPLEWLTWEAVGRHDATVSLTAAAAVGKFLLLVLPIVVAFQVVGRLVLAVFRSKQGDFLGGLVDVPDGGLGRWHVPSDLDGTVSAVARNSDDYGIALSGGGIRSATFALGALQTLDSDEVPEAWRLRSARWVSAVSGGSYMAAAHQYLAHQAVAEETRRHEWAETVHRERALAPTRLKRWRRQDQPAQVIPVPAVAMDGTVPTPIVPRAGEVESHFRRHAMHLADGAQEWLLAIGEVAVKLVSGLAFLLLALWAAAVPLGWLFRYVLYGVDEMKRPAPRLDLRIVAIPLLAFAVLTVIRWVTSGTGMFRTRRSGTGRAILTRDGARATTLFALASTVLAVLVVPFLTSYVDDAADVAAGWLGIEEPATPAAAAADEVPVEEDPPLRWAGLSAIVTLVGGFVGRRRIKAASAAPSEPSPTGKKSDVYRKLGFGGRIEVLAGVACVALLVVAVSDVAVDSWTRGIDFETKVLGTQPAWVWWAVAVGLLAVAYLVVNVNVWSLRPFYHRRLWAAYAVTRKGDTENWNTDTRLSVAGRRVEGFPELLICAAAQTSGRDLAPPGRRALPFVFSAGTCGGPDVGYVRTEALEWLLGKERRGVMTLFGAVATSGAAFGPAMGRHSKGGLGAVMAIANARLGAWIPNPRHLVNVSELRSRATVANVRAGSLTTWPRLGYWIREIFGQYPPDGRLVLTTDGGHYENLGLLELLRRRCARVAVFDASGAGATPTTLAEAVVLAREELDVAIELFLPDGTPLLDVDNFGADPLRRSLGGDQLKARIAAQPVLRGRIHYPKVGDAEAFVGELCYGTLVLAGDDARDWDVLEYAQRNPVFPNDGTDQQWFRANTFAAYHQLGRRVAARMLPRPASPEQRSQL